ncbi:hypothetical protein [Priestia koreensis]|nr:hypothetical protein [Priestia koreensis]
MLTGILITLAAGIFAEELKSLKEPKTLVILGMLFFILFKIS